MHQLLFANLPISSNLLKEKLFVLTETAVGKSVLLAAYFKLLL